VYEHKNKLAEGFTKKYNVNKLVFYEIYNNINEAITREKANQRLFKGKENKTSRRNE
jgi:putative endonuclease